jgi:hypothetical protein
MIVKSGIARDRARKSRQLGQLRKAHLSVEG